MRLLPLFIMALTASCAVAPPPQEVPLAVVSNRFGDATVKALDAAASAHGG